MNQVHDIQRLTIAEAANHPALGSISVEDIATDQETITASIAKFVWLRALDPDSEVVSQFEIKRL